MLGILLSLVAAVTWGIGGVFVRLGAPELKISTGTYVSIISSLILTLVIALTVHLQDFASFTVVGILWFGLVGVVNFRLGRHFNYMGIDLIGVARSSPIIASSPLFAMVMAITFLGESVNLYIIVGTVLVVTGLSLVMSKE